ncbi:hypothetical protein BDW22DRAFT_1043617 [Trametopsis cervina]|nr:hypothetical protein BDW22DRAFT_1043617 [Trametopsis cervina]
MNRIGSTPHPVLRQRCGHSDFFVAGVTDTEVSPAWSKLLKTYWFGFDRLARRGSSTVTTCTANRYSTVCPYVHNRPAKTKIKINHMHMRMPRTSPVRRGRNFMSRDVPWVGCRTGINIVLWHLYIYPPRICTPNLDPNRQIRPHMAWPCARSGSGIQ